MSFDDDIALRPLGDGRYEGEISDEWRTPRGPLGGYVMALMLRGMEEAVADPGRMPRSCTMHFLRPPKPGPITVETTVERTGRTLTSVSGRMVQEDKLMGLALGAFSTAWESPLLAGDPMPDVEPPQDRMTSGRRGIPDILPPPFLERVVFQHRFGAPHVQRCGRGRGGRLARPA